MKSKPMILVALLLAAFLVNLDTTLVNVALPALVRELHANTTQLLNVTPSAAPISELPLVLIPAAAAPLLFALHLTSVLALVRAPRTRLPASGPLIADAAPRTGVAESPAPR